MSDRDDFDRMGAEAVGKLDELARRASCCDLPEEVKDGIVFSTALVGTCDSLEGRLRFQKLMIIVAQNCYRAGYARGRDEVLAGVGRG